MKLFFFLLLAASFTLQGMVEKLKKQNAEFEKEYILGQLSTHKLHKIPFKAACVGLQEGQNYIDSVIRLINLAHACKDKKIRGKANLLLSFIFRAGLGGASPNNGLALCYLAEAMAKDNNKKIRELAFSYFKAHFTYPEALSYFKKKCHVPEDFNINNDLF